MFSIRNLSVARSRRLLAILALAGVAPVLGGCNLKYRRPIEAANDPQSSDEAMSKRNWPQQDALYANSTLEAYKQRFPYNYDAIAQQRREQAIVAAPLAFVVQTIVLPFTFFKNPPGTKQTFSTLQQEPSYTVMPSRPELATDVVRGGSETGSQFQNQQNGQLNNGNNAPSGDNLLGNRPAGQQTPQGQTPATPLPRNNTGTPGNNTGAPNNSSSGNPNAPGGQGGNSVPNPITPPGGGTGGTGTGTGGTGTGGTGSGTGGSGGGSGGSGGGGGAGGR